MSARIVFSFIAYVLSYILLHDSFIYRTFLTLFKTEIRTFIIINIAVLVFTGLCYKKFEKVISVICIFFAAPSVMLHSKLLIAIILSSELGQYFTSNSNAVLFLLIIVFLMAANRLERLDRQYDEMISGGALEADVNLITLNNIKMYSIFLAVALLSGLVLIALGSIVPKIGKSLLTAIAMVVIGIGLVLGCVLYLYRKWIKK
ncbi:MAG TPA: hypothetical protein PLH43_07100 [Acetivibrio sp.]|uniref:hypothetical protein n=1 Tax=Acetivibrio sp. TaxID=1872092 RepID=UPI002C0DA9F4|nr:hypothetical protein [Acetivibrio sp.]HOM02577.1 hypothetical protein [Acetivibrio sp.]